MSTTETYTQEQTKQSWYEKGNKFLTSNPWGGAISSGIDLAGSLIKSPPGYSGKKGHIQAGLDQAYDSVSNAVMAIPGWGTVAGLGMKALGVLNKGIQRLGGGTDGMTTTDAILSSSFLGWTPLGMINGFGGKKAKSYTRNDRLDTQSGAGFSGFQTLQNTTQVGAGKKYGLFSSGAREKQDELTQYTQGIRHTISGIVDTNTINNLASQSTSPFSVARFQTDINGGIQNLRAAAKGGSLFRYKKPKKLEFAKYDVLKYTLGDDWQVAYDPYGRRTAIPKTLNRAQKLGVAPIPTQLGTIVYMGNNGKLQSKPVNSKYSIDDFKNGGFTKRVISRYQQGNRLKRTVKVFNRDTGKYLEIPIPLSKEQIAGNAPIRLPGNIVVFLNSDGTVTSDKWETPGAREHLTPKGQNGMKTPQHKNGGQMNVIPEGALHARKNHLTEVDDMYQAVTHKGIPVITIEEGGEVVQHAEVEHSEIIFTKEVTDKIEAYRKEGTDDAALECGKLLVQEILYNTDDRTGLIQTIE